MMPAPIRPALPLWAAILALAVLSGPGFAQGAAKTGAPGRAAVARLSEILQLDAVLAVMRDEGLRYGRQLDTDMLGGRGGAAWEARVARIYDTGRMGEPLRRALAAGMSAGEITQSLGFFDTMRGQRILTLETEARIAIADPQVEATARAAYAALAGSGDARLGAVTRFVEINDLLERNVASALNADYEFYRGLIEGGGAKMDDTMILARVWGREAEIRKETEAWIFAYLLMAYRPLADADLEAYMRFSATRPGRALNAALFAGFDAMYRDISYRLGRAVARAMDAREL